MQHGFAVPLFRGLRDRAGARTQWRWANAGRGETESIPIRSARGKTQKEKPNNKYFLDPEVQNSDGCQFQRENAKPKVIRQKGIEQKVAEQKHVSQRRDQKHVLKRTSKTNKKQVDEVSTKNIFRW